MASLLTAPGKPVPVITGPTASGKTAVAVELAKLLNGEVISADSMQVYRHLSVGTAKPMAAELQGVPYHLIDHVDPDDQYNLGRFVAEAQKCMVTIRERGKVPIICGGTGLYIRGLLYGVFSGGEAAPEVRKKLDQRLEQEGLQSLFADLERVDPESAARYGRNDRQRVVRALEVYHSTGRPLSSYHSQDLNRPLFPATVFVLTRPRPQLYDRINQRVNVMVEQGLIDEVQRYLDSGWSRENPAIKALGYLDIIDALEGRITMDQALEKMKQKSRNYAKRQETWYRSMKNAVWINCENLHPVDVANHIWEELEKLPQ